VIRTDKRGDDMTDRLEQTYRIPQVAKALCVKDRVIYRMLNDGRLTGVKLSNRWRVRAADLQAFLDANTVKRSAVKQK